MSTKIYDGKRLPDMSVLELHRFCQQLKRDLLPIAKTAYCKLIANIAQSAYMYNLTGQNICKYHVDIPKLGKPNSDLSMDEIFFFAKEQARKLVLDTSAAIRRVDSESDADFDVTICVFPIHDKLLCLPYANHDHLHDALFATTEFVEYGYWNNVDPPKNVTEEEWNQRKDDWDAALPGLGIPRECGMTFKIIDAKYDIVYNDVVAIDDILPHFISDEEMCSNFARHVIFEREFQNAVEEFGGDWIRNGYKSLMRAEAYVSNHQDEIAKIACDYRDVIDCTNFFSSKNYQ